MAERPAGSFCAAAVWVFAIVLFNAGPALAEGPLSPLPGGLLLWNEGAVPPELFADREGVGAGPESPLAKPQAGATLRPDGVISTTPLGDEVDLRTWGVGDEPWSLQLLPDRLIYRSYLAGIKESRFASAWMYEERLGWIWDITLGGRVGLLRYGTTDSRWPEGWQLDIEGACFPRLDLEHNLDLPSVDFRFGVPLTYGMGRYQTKLAFYHLSSHMGDELMVREQSLVRINYTRDVLVWGNSWFLSPDVRVYGEVAFAYRFDGGSKPWEFQFGLDYSPIRAAGLRGSPFLALNSHLRQEVDYGGNFVLQTGWQWRGPSGHLVRMGFEYFTGTGDQLEFYNRYENKVGLGLWYDY